MNWGWMCHFVLKKHYFLTNQYFSYNLWKYLLISTTCNILILWDEWKSCQYFDGYCLFWITVLSHVNTRLYFKELFVKSVFSRWLFEWMTTERVLSSPRQDNLVSKTIRNFKKNNTYIVSSIIQWPSIKECTRNWYWQDMYDQDIYGYNL